MITFLQINLMLAVTYLLFFGVQKIEGLLKINSSPKAFLRCAQLLIILSLASPLLLKMMPVKKLPVNQPTFRMFKDYDNSNFKQTQSKINSFVKAAPAKVETIDNSVNVDYKVIALSLWLVGIAFFIAKFTANYIKLNKLLVNAVVLKQTKKLKIVIADNVTVPFSVRMFKLYWVVIPVDLLNSKIDLSLAIKHELQHHRQGDTAWAVVIEMLSCILFFNPVIYLWKNTIIEFQEFSCDEALTGQKDVLSHDYGSCLLRVAETALINRQVYAGTTSMAVVFKNSRYFKTFLLRRIEMIVKEKKSTSKWIPICTGLVLAILTVTFAYGVEKVSRTRPKKPNSGVAVVDVDVQKIADESLAKAMKNTKSTAGFVIVTDPMTGKVLAVANMDKKNNRKGHWALSQMIEPASFAKTFVIAEAIEKNETSADEKHQCENGQYKYKGSVYRDWKTVGWKELTTSETLAISSDICSIKIGEKVGANELEKMVENFGFGSDSTAKDFPEAAVGEVPENGAQFIPQVTLGFNFQSTPLELMSAYGAIANGGNLMKPIMANSKPEVLRKVLSAESAEKMKALLQNVVLTGTGKRGATSSFYTMAGKTASAYLNDYMKIDWYGGKQHANFAGFIGFAPVNKPRVQVYVGLINPNTDNTGAHGGDHAAPVFKEVAENVLAYMKVAPDKI